MKRMIFILAALFMATTAFAQYNDAATDFMTMKKGSLWLGQEKITKENVQIVFSYVEFQERWRNVNTGYKTGLGLTIGGSALTAAGVTLVACFLDDRMLFETKSIWLDLFGNSKDGLEDALNGLKEESVLALSGDIMVSVGIPILLAGIPTLCVYKSRMKNLAEDYNASKKSTEMSLSFGNQAYGLGFALNF